MLSWGAEGPTAATHTRLCSTLPHGTTDYTLPEGMVCWGELVLVVERGREVVIMQRPTDSLYILRSDVLQ